MKKWYFIKINSRNEVIKMDKHKDFITKVLPVMALFITTVNVFAQTDHRVKNLKQIEISGNHAEEIYQFMLELNKEKYLKWSKAHIDYRVVEQTPNFVGSKIFFYENIEGLHLNSVWEVTKIIENQRIELKSKKLGVPIFLNLNFENKGDKTIINHEVMGGYKSANPVNWFIKTFVFTKRKMKAETKHAFEEFTYFETLKN